MKNRFKLTWMNKVMLCSALGFFAFCLLLASCSNNEVTQPPVYDISASYWTDVQIDKLSIGAIKRIAYEGHTYMIYREAQGIGMAHDPDCACYGKETPKEKSKQ